MKKSPGLHVSQLNSHLGYWLRTVSNSVSYSFARSLESSDVTVAEWVVLREMYGADKTTSPSVVAELTGLTRGAVSKLIERLMKKGFVTRSEANGDRRFQDVRLTAAAIRLVPKLAQLADENDRKFFHVLAKSECESLMKILKKLAEQHKITKAPIK